MKIIERYTNSKGVSVYRETYEMRLLKSDKSKALHIAHKIVKRCKRDYNIVSMSEALKRAWNAIKNEVVDNIVNVYCFTENKIFSHKGMRKVILGFDINNISIKI